MKVLTKSVLGVSAAILAGGAMAAAPVLVAAYGDNTGTAEGRPVYTIEEIENGALGPDKITFNSITNGTIGDERNFVTAKKTSEVANPSILWKDYLDVQDGEEYTIRLYVHNNNAPTRQAYEAGNKAGAMATGVSANFSLPTGAGTELSAIGYINAPNATPTRYFDEVYFKSDKNFYLEYVPGSAIYKNNAGTFNLSNDVSVGTGTLLGYDKMDGNIPGCYQYDGTVYINVIAHESVTADVAKTVRMAGTKDTFGEVVNAKVGDEVEYQIAYTNLAQEEVKDVILRDILPTNVEYVPGSTKLFDSNHPNWTTLSEDTLTTTGINLGDFPSKTNAAIRFTGKVVDKTLACGENQLVNWANSTSDNTVTAKDDASVMVSKTCANQPTTNKPVQQAVATKPGTIVSTGPEGIVAGALAAGGVTTALSLAIASRKKLM